MPKVGAHVSAAVSLELAFEKAKQIGAECTQIFVSPPQQWSQNLHDEEEIARFIKAQEGCGIGPNFIHGTYLINLGTKDYEHLQKSTNWLIYALDLANKLKIQGIIFHIGSHKGAGFEKISDQVVDCLKRILEKSSRTPQLILETSAGGGGTIGRNFKELGYILKEVGDPRLKVCLDTQHIFATGYDIKTLIGLQDTIKEFEEEIGLKHLAVIHANDSKTEYKSSRDRHENIGEGLIGKEAFENIVNHPQLQDIPFILEVPGFSGNGPDEENVKYLKSLIKA